jgi:hypothetical protein
MHLSILEFFLVLLVALVALVISVAVLRGSREFVLFGLPLRNRQDSV